MHPMIVNEHLAHRWMLRSAPHTHGLRQAAIEQYAREMRAGYWYCSGVNPITFDDDGYVIDGRCRLEAVRLAGIPIRLWVTGWHFGGPCQKEQGIA